MSRNLNVRGAIRSAITAALLVSLSVPVSAEESVHVLHRVINFADLDLTHRAGVEALYVRIRAAAREVCEPPIASDRQAVTSARTCAEEAIARAITDVNAPLLTSYYLAKAHPPRLTLSALR